MKFKDLFESTIQLDNAITDIADRLKSLKIQYALIGGLALGFYGYKRFTHDIDLLIDKDGYEKLIKSVIGLGYKYNFNGARGIQHTEYKIPIDFIFSGEVYGSFTYPKPQDVKKLKNGVCVVSLPKLIEIKIASGLNNQKRPNDLADAQLLIRHNINNLRGLKISDDELINKKYMELCNIEGI